MIQRSRCNVLGGYVAALPMITPGDDASAFLKPTLIVYLLRLRSGRIPRARVSVFRKEEEVQIRDVILELGRRIRQTAAGGEGAVVVGSPNQSRRRRH